VKHFFQFGRSFLLLAIGCHHLPNNKHFRLNTGINGLDIFTLVLLGLTLGRTFYISRVFVECFSLFFCSGLCSGGDILKPAFVPSIRVPLCVPQIAVFVSHCVRDKLPFCSGLCSGDDLRQMNIFISFLFGTVFGTDTPKKNQLKSTRFSQLFTNPLSFFVHR